MKNENHIILFDGVCNLCNSAVQFLIKRDKKAKFKFASLQSVKGQELLRKFHLPEQQFETFVYINQDKAFLKSSAGLKVLKELGGVWTLFYGFIVLPRSVRDFLYSLIANNRYRLFGKKDQCMMPTPELTARFLD